MVGEFDLPAKDWAKDKMTRSISTLLMVLVPCVLVYAGPARAQYLPPPNAAQSPAGQPVIEPSSFDANSVLTARAQYVPPPYAPQSPIFQRQHVALSSSFDADSLGNRNAYVDSTFAPFSGIYESGVRFRLLGNASWYKFVTSEDPRILGSGRYLEGAFLAGYGVYVPGFNITWLVGPAFAESVNEGVITDRWGARAAIEIYARPTDLTMASTSANYSTVTDNLQVQAKLGLKVFGDVYFGPEPNSHGKRYSRCR